MVGSTVEIGVAGGIDGSDIFDVFGGALVAGGLQFFLAFGPVGVLVDLGLL